MAYWRLGLTCVLVEMIRFSPELFVVVLDAILMYRWFVLDIRSRVFPVFWQLEIVVNRGKYFDSWFG